MSASNGGKLGRNPVFTLSILPNDNPYGTVEFEHNHYHLVEHTKSTIQQIALIRR